MFGKSLSVKVFFVIVLLVHSLHGNPVVIKDSSPHGETIVAISSSDPNLERYLTLNVPQRSNTETGNERIEDYNIVSPGETSAGTGRSFVSTSSYNPFLFPLFNLPLNLEGLGLSNVGLPDNWFRSIENFYDPSIGNGEIKTVTAVNDNGHVYGKINSVNFDNRPKN